MSVEAVVVAVAVLLMVVLVVLRARRSRSRRLRLGAASGYFDREAARYAHSAGGPGAGASAVTLAPSFTSVPKRMGRRSSAGATGPVPRPVPSFVVLDAGTVPDLDADRSVVVPAFAGSVPVRPLPTLPLLPPPPPGRPGAGRAAGATPSFLPTLEQPPPPPLREAPPA